MGGEIETVTVGINHRTGQPKGHAFVQFRHPQDAQDAHYKYQGYGIEGRSLHIDWDAGRRNKMRRYRRERRPYDRDSYSRRSRRDYSYSPSPPRSHHSPPHDRSPRRGSPRSPLPTHSPRGSPRHERSPLNDAPRDEVRGSPRD